MVATRVAMTGQATTPAASVGVTSVQIELIVDPGQAIPGLGYVDANDDELVGSVGVTVDQTTGTWTALLYANADIRPAGSYYRARYVVDGIQHPDVFFQAVAGGGWIGDHLVQPPANIPDASSSGRLIAYTEIAANLAVSSTTPADLTGAAITVPVGTRPITVEFYAGNVVSSAADKSCAFYLYDDVPTLLQGGWVGLGQTYALGEMFELKHMLNPLPTPGLRTYKIQAALGEAGGTRTVNGLSNGFIPTRCFMRALEH